MSLLPKTHQDFTQTEYWNSFFQKRGKKSFEWYGEYPELCGHLHKYMKPKDDILNVGCGNSKLTMDLYDVGYRNIYNIDTSQLVINQMLDQNKVDRPDLKYLQMDACDMSQFEGNKFSVILDKATIDAVMVDDSADIKDYVHKYWSEISRVLRVGGRYVCISLLQKHIIEAMIEFFAKNNWMFRVVRCIEAEEKTNETSNDGTSLPVFIAIATKFQKLPSLVLEVCMAGDKMVRLQEGSEVVNAVLSVQKAALVCNGLHRGNIADMNEVSMDLFRPSDSVNPRFTVHVLDQKPKRGNGKYAAFIVPQGRETEWLFSTPQGRKKLLASAHHDRLSIVSMHRGQIYTTWDEVKDELSSSIRNLAPSGLKDQQIPYLSLGSDVGKREVIFKGKSNLSGDYIVEEVTGQDGKILRRLIFLSNQFVIQSEALVKTVKGGKNDKSIRKVIEPTYLACQHHLYMTVGIDFALEKIGKKRTNNNVAVIGLGGGGLCTFIHQIIRDAKIAAVDIDSAMLTIATNYFGLVQNDRLKVVIDDGIEFLNKQVKMGKAYKAILFDVDSKDPSLGMSCPPIHFLDQGVLDAVKSCIRDNGIFVLNLVTRDEKLRETAFEKLQKTFKTIVSYKLEEDVNEILYCQTGEHDLVQWKNRMEQSVKHINDLLNAQTGSRADSIEVQEFLNELKL